MIKLTPNLTDEYLHEIDTVIDMLIHSLMDYHEYPIDKLRYEHYKFSEDIYFVLDNLGFTHGIGMPEKYLPRVDSIVEKFLLVTENMKSFVEGLTNFMITMNVPLEEWKSFDTEAISSGYSYFLARLESKEKLVKELKDADR
jgi:hypothetical protein